MWVCMLCVCVCVCVCVRVCFCVFNNVTCIRMRTLNTNTTHPHKTQLPPPHRAQAVLLEPEPFSVDTDLMTPKFSLKRPQLLKRYQQQVRGC